MYTHIYMKTSASLHGLENAHKWGEECLVTSRDLFWLLWKSDGVSPDEEDSDKLI